VFSEKGDSFVYAIIQAGGRQIKVAPGVTVELDGRAADAGKEVTFEQVLFLAKDGGELLAGAPFVAGAKVLGVVDGESRGPKIRVFKKKRRKGFRKTSGHRAFYTRVRITDIQI
jgi:large subunit ribosomal protein L21